MAWIFGAVVLMAACFGRVTQGGIMKGHSIQLPPDCKEGFCTTKPEGYDQLQVHIDEKIKALNLNMNMEDRYGNENVTERGGDSLNCRYTTTTIKPYKLAAKSANHLLIVQSEIFEQVINVTKCDDVNEYEMQSSKKQCFTTSLLASEVYTECKDKEIDIEFHVYNTKKHNIEKVKLPVSVWCSCHVGIQFENK